MKKLTIASALALALAAPTALADRDKIKVRLTGFQEVPVVSTPGTATLEATINRDETAIDWELTYQDMQADVTQAHIHIAQKRVNGGIVLWFCKTTQVTTGTNNICTLRNGSFSGTFTAADVQAQPAQGIAAGDFAEVVAAIRAGNAYANVHTVQSPGGEIRGQLDDKGHGHDHHH
jgi:hypothetical protein